MKATKAARGMTRNDSIGLSRGQHAELYVRDGTLRLVIDHSSNAPLMGAHTGAILVRASDLTVGPDDGTAVVYVSRGGAAFRIATATAVRQESGAVGLTDWRIEPGYDHATTAEAGAAVHRITRQAEAPST